MLYTYPSNKLENLVTALDTLLSVSQKPVLAPDVILVQHPGMQHWLSMALAKQPNRQICMNTVYPLPVRYFWDLIRLILGPEHVPDRSPYTREILAWRIFNILEQKDIIDDPLMAEPTNYWQKQKPALQASRRFQLSEQLADLYEQYLMYRPDDFILQWENNPAEHWQAKIWQALAQQDPNHPLKLMRLATKQLDKPAKALPDNFYIFGVNTLAPIWLDFLANVADKTDTNIHLLYLNPSAEQWDDISSEKKTLKEQAKQLARHRATWVGNEQTFDADLYLECGNPLLSGFGLQGQAFVSLLSDRAHYDTHVFSSFEGDKLLHKVQQDILELKDARTSPQQHSLDDSLMITSAHSAFREVQGLHDWLLHQFNNDPTLTPKDVLVMCPGVEDYAPYVQAVFARSFADIKDSTPPLPCSIADRNLKDADPTVSAFLELLTLPDARFEVSQIISWLRIPAIADKFNLAPSDIQQLIIWLNHANIHWGLSAEHKSQWLDNSTTDHFSWKQGLDRLLLGFAYGDENTFVNGFALLPDVEGDSALLLGKLTHIIEQLGSARSNLNRARTPGQWQQYLIEQLQLALLSDEPEFARSNQTILTAINNVTEFANRAGLSETNVTLAVIRHVLESAFASPEQTGSQFMTGQITICSMVPMRSIPFKVIAILGLNDGQFPRNRPPLGFDLMAQETPRLGDRSRRGDDRYLFLEAIMSARQSLYLSYQGFDIHKNEPRPPSLVVEELLAYLSAGYGVDAETQTRTLPLQPFSPRNYHGTYPSFDPQWLHNTQSAGEAHHKLATQTLAPEKISLTDLIAFYSHPARYFAHKRLGLFLQADTRYTLEDTEPFTTSHLDRYDIQQSTVKLSLNNETDDELFERKAAASELPLHFLTEENISLWQEQASSFASIVKIQAAQSVTLEEINTTIDQTKVSGLIPMSNIGNCITWRLANAKGKDLITLWLQHLLANTRSPIQSIGVFRGKNDSVETIELTPVENAATQLKQLLDVYLQGLCEPLLLNGDLGMALLRNKFEEKHFKMLWEVSFNAKGLVYDPYIQHFWPQRPDYPELRNAIEIIYGSIASSITFNELKPEVAQDA